MESIIMILILVAIPIAAIFTLKYLIRFTAKTVYEEKEKARQKYEAKGDTKKPFTQADFERWKQDNGGFVDLDAPVRLPWQRTA